MNTAKVFLMMTGLVLLFMAIGYYFGGQSGMILAFAIACVMNFIAYWASDKMVLKMYRAIEVKPGERGKPGLLYDVVRNIATINGMPMPRVYVIPTKAPNAFATGRNAEHAAVAATEGLLEILNREELEGVMGHEMAHVKNKDMLIGTIAATFVGAIGILASLARWGAIFGGYSRDERGGGGGGIGLLVAALLAPFMAILLQTAISRQREYKADAIGGRLGAPGGRHLQLASALQKIHQAPYRLNLDDRPGTANLMIANPLSGRGLTNLFSTHPPLEKRIAKLKEHAQQAVYQGYAG
ncbi:MAG: zinc metalloprotease HtpX [candidate division Zixibacteria bacterium]|jgi:heat shock protein HtpX|nr:zinc metalloprotease HtpX [candidate division Zixibacteria bacterium]